MVKRSNAKAGDDLWVTGTIGDAYLGLRLAQKKKDVIDCHATGAELWHWEEAFRHPTPRLLFRKILRRYATSSVDISDGLLSEASHLAKASACKISLNLSDVPLSDGSKKWCLSDLEEMRRIALATGGDDYELLFTSSPIHRQALIRKAEKVGLSVTRIGKVDAGKGFVCLDLHGEALSLDKLGYSHS